MDDPTRCPECGDTYDRCNARTMLSLLIDKVERAGEDPMDVAAWRRNLETLAAPQQEKVG